MSRGPSLRPCGHPGPKPEDLGWMTARSSTGSWMCGVTGCRWRDRPRPYGADQTAWQRFRELQEKGIWHKILQALPDWGYTLGKVKVEAVAVDSTRVEAKKGGKV